MAILSINANISGLIGVRPRIVYIKTDDSFSTITAANYLKPVITSGMASFYADDMAIVSYGTNDTQFFKIQMANGEIQLLPVNKEISLPVINGNIVQFDGTDGTLSDGPVAANKVLTSAITTPDVGANLISFDVTVGQAALATGGSVTLISSTGTKQYKIRGLWLNSGGTNFSGGGGNRLGQVTDNTTVFSVIPAATMQTLANERWGNTGLPFPASAALNTSTAAGANLVFKYSGGTTDYTAGSLVISGLIERLV